MTNSLIRRTIVCAGIAALSISLVGQTARAKQTTEPKTTTNAVDCNKGASIQTAVDAVKGGDPIVIMVTGTCTEDVTITKDDLTLEGDATVDGVMTIRGAQRTTIDDLTINSVRVEDGASVTFNGAFISSNGSTAVTALRSALLVMENTTIDAIGGCAVFIGDGSVLRMNGGNALTDDVSGFACPTLSVYRNSTARIQGPGNTITNTVAVTNLPSIRIAGGIALDVEMVSSVRIDGDDQAIINGNVESFNLSTVDLRTVEVNGSVYADGLGANIRLRGNSTGDTIVNGNVFPGSSIDIRNAGEVKINGNIDCSNGANVRSDFAHFGDPPTDGYVNC